MKINCSICLIGFFLLIACHNTRTDAQKLGDKPDYRSLALKKYGENAEYRFNPSKTHVICLKGSKPTAQDPIKQISFFAYDLQDEEIILEESSINGEVEWKNDHEIQVRLIPGILTTDESYNEKLTGYIFDVRLRKKL